MTPKTVLACLTDEAGAPALARAAASLAARWNAHLVGLHVTEDLLVGPTLSGELSAALNEKLKTQQEWRAARLEEIFAEATMAEQPQSEWRLVETGNVLASDRLIESARGADLVMMGAAEDGSDQYRQSFLQEAVIRRSGRPVLMVPKDTTVGAMDRAVIGWSDTAQATRALHDLVPLLAPGAAVKIAAFGDGPRLGDSGDVMTELAAALARHGFEVEIARRTERSRSVPDALEAEAREFGADLLAVGAYGHSRLYDLILGAVSRQLLREARMPVLFSR